MNETPANLLTEALEAATRAYRHAMSTMSKEERGALIGLGGDGTPTHRMDVLVEVHDEKELDRALALETRLIGINNRNLHDFSVSLDICERLAEKAPRDKIIVAESGIHSRADVERLSRCGARAILVGESLMRNGDVRAKARELLGA